MGIGLAICQSIVAAHHGSITATNNPGGGTTFCVSLPVERCDMTEASAAPTIFLVDDDPSVLKALSRVLREDGWSVETFESAEAFLARPESDGGRVPRARRDDAGPRRPRAATPARGRGRIVADRVHQRARRHSDVGARHQGGRDGFPDQAGRGQGAGGGGARRDRAARCDAQGDGRRRGPSPTARKPHSARARRARRRWRRESSTSRSPRTWAWSSRPSSSTGPASWTGCRRRPPRS